MEIMNDIIERMNQYQILKEAKTPEVGIFWVNCDHLIIDSTPMNDPDVFENTKTIDHKKLHKDFWNNLKKARAPIAIEQTWLYLLRGRVIFNKEEKIFWILTDLSRFTNEHLSMVLEDFNLHSSITKVVDNDHYHQNWKSARIQKLP